MSEDSYNRTGVQVAIELINEFCPNGSPEPTLGTDEALVVLERILTEDPVSVAQLDTNHADVFAGLARQLRQVIEALDSGKLDRGAELVNAMLVQHPATPALDREEDGTWRLHHHPLTAELGAMWFAICAEGLARELSDQNHERFGICRADGCERVYFDTSRNTARQFCSLTCQNRTKVAAFRARRRRSGQPYR